MSNREKTIDSAGNVTDKPYGVSRWSSPRVRDCKHEGCSNAAVVLSTAHTDVETTHNCCKEHDQ